ncbi:MAG TPA: hypothetical protein VK901_17890 [Nitrospiraceae bacterium]|nr:hypothetical protein [Nitrospiraceae bacterium]
MPKPADIGDTANLEKAVIDRILELIHAIKLNPAQRKELLRRVAVRLEQEEGADHRNGQRWLMGGGSWTHALPLTTLADLTTTVHWARG